EEPPTAENFVDWFDTDGDGVLTLDEIIDGIRTTNNVSGELPPSAEDEAYMEAAFNDADENADGVLDLDELGHFIYVIDGDDDGDEEGDDEPFQVTMMVLDQTLNAPISDFEVRFLGDCGEPDEEGNEPPISECTVYASNGLTEGSATVDPEVAEYEFTWSYLDYDGDGMISTMDTLVIDNLMPGVQVELYDTWADQYTSDSFASAEMLPGFGALMAVVVLLGAAFATRRD
ncbi:PGF-CTERM sorting domain-containing protein, partial [Candidatus Thalassarchaeum betae]|uniref:PGF-CTERM sorting domain-containing protein n=1 Tax=Candidatus Thalassarchaeum betae TaxID=2599289 RepID=UPI0030C689F9|nr:PGF-CTERM sorting domain-containing protein [Candidatus Thalassoarchaea betae]